MESGEDNSAELESLRSMKAELEVRLSENEALLSEAEDKKVE